MRIIINHRLSPINFKKKWIYFGSSFIKQKKCESEIDGIRINFSSLTKKEFNNNRKSLSEWVNKLRIKNFDKIEWWTLQFACRNNLVSKTFLNLVQFLAIKKILNKLNRKDEILIICEDYFLLKFLKSNLSAKNIIVHNTLFNFFIGLFEKYAIFLKGVLKQIIIIFILLKLKIITFLLKKPKSLPKGKIILFHHALEKGENNFSCRYFKQLPKWIKNKGHQVYKIPWFYNRGINFSYIKQLQLNNFLIFDRYLSIKDYYYIYKTFLKSFKCLSILNNYQNIDVKNLFTREKLFNMQEPTVFFLRYIPALAKILNNVDSIKSYDHFENMPFEHPLRYALKKLNSKVKNIGFFHSLVSKNFFLYNHTKVEWKSNIKPEIIICTGTLSKSFLIKNNVPSRIIKTAVALRQKKEIKEKYKVKKNILILLPLELSSSVELLSKIFLNKDKIFKKINSKIVIKPHPLSDFDLIKKNSNISSFPKNWSVSLKSINHELSKTMCCITMSSASIFDAIINHNFVISLKSDFDLYDNYLDFVAGGNRYFQSMDISQLNKILEGIYIRKKKGYIYPLKTVRNRIINGTNFPTSQNLKTFLV